MNDDTKHYGLAGELRTLDGMYPFLVECEMREDNLGRDRPTFDVSISLVAHKAGEQTAGAEITYRSIPAEELLDLCETLASQATAALAAFGQRD